MKNIKRITGMTDEEFRAWKEARLTAGQKKYGKAHLLRNGILDIAEELLDADNIAELHMKDRWGQMNLEAKRAFHDFILSLDKTIQELITLETHLKDSCLDDIAGGKRVGLQERPDGYYWVFVKSGMLEGWQVAFFDGLMFTLDKEELDEEDIKVGERLVAPSTSRAF